MKIPNAENTYLPPEGNKLCLESLLTTSTHSLEKTKALAVQTYRAFPMNIDVSTNYCIYVGIISSMSAALQKAMKHNNLAKEDFFKIIEGRELAETESHRDRVKAESKKAFIMSSIASFIPSCIQNLALKTSHGKIAQMNLAEYISVSVKDEVMIFIRKIDLESYNQEIKKAVRSIRRIARVAIRLAVAQIYDRLQVENKHVSTPEGPKVTFEAAGDVDGMNDSVNGKLGKWTSRTPSLTGWQNADIKRNAYLGEAQFSFEYGGSPSEALLSSDSLPGLGQVMTRNITSLDNSALILINKEVDENDIYLHIIQEILLMVESEIGSTDDELFDEVNTVVQKTINEKRNLTSILRLELEECLHKEYHLATSAQSLIGRAVANAQNADDVIKGQNAFKQLMLHRYEKKVLMCRIAHNEKILFLLDNVHKLLQSM
ncbi:hypothetical protein [Sodalis praecaptivus]|nr:hypothetical protein [Sodalis praecaptivus]